MTGFRVDGPATRYALSLWYSRLHLRIPFHAREPSGIRPGRNISRPTAGIRLTHIALHVPWAEPRDGRRSTPRTTARVIHLTDHYWTWLEILLLGSHVFYRQPDGRTTTVPNHSGRVLAPPLLREILREINLAPDQFREESRRL